MSVGICREGFLRGRDPPPLAGQAGAPRARRGVPEITRAKKPFLTFINDRTISALKRQKTVHC